MLEAQLKIEWAFLKVFQKTSNMIGNCMVSPNYNDLPTSYARSKGHVSSNSKYIAAVTKLDKQLT